MTSISTDSTPLATCPKKIWLKDTTLIQDTQVVGAYFPEQNRIQWSWDKFGVEPSLITMAQTEMNQWDQWADTELSKFDYNYLFEGANTRFSIPGWLKRFKNIGAAVEMAKLNIELHDKKILDIGGSGIDMVYWLRDSPRRIDQVEVSPASQHFCSRRVSEICRQQKMDVPPIYYHTIPAEYLPFEEGSFDFIFSRSTLHQCRRPEVFQQIARVLRPGGIVFFTESYLSDWAYNLMKIRRYILRSNRGTDKPIRSSEINVMKMIVAGTKSRIAVVFHHNLFLHYLGFKHDQYLPSKFASNAMQVTFIAKKGV